VGDWNGNWDSIWRFNNFHRNSVNKVMDRKKEIGRDNGIDLGEVEIVRF
jgi:hypothetical protein